MNGKPFFGGLPVQPDVDKLVAFIGVPGKGDQITYAKFGAALGIDPSKSEKDRRRLHSVIRAWRKILKETHKLDTAAIPGVGIEVLTSEAGVNRSISDTRQLRRKAGRLVERVGLVEPSELSASGKAKYEHARLVAAQLFEHAANSHGALTRGFRAAEQLTSGGPPPKDIE